MIPFTDHRHFWLLWLDIVRLAEPELQAIIDAAPRKRGKRLKVVK